MLSRIRRTRRAFLCAFVLSPLAAAVLAGCADQGTIASGVGAVSLTGNWQFSSSAPVAKQLPAISGTLNGSGASVSGLLHAQAVGGCVSPTTVIEVSGSTGNDDVTTLSGPLAGGTLTVRGTLTADGKSLDEASYTVTGGTCAFAAPAAATAQAFTPIHGTYAGTLTDSVGSQFQVTATLTQSPAADTSGNYTLNGTASFPGATVCIASPTPLTSATVTGGTFTSTYTDAASGNTATTSGTFSADASTLTIGAWSLGGACAGQSGTGGVLKLQQQ